jgi:hypothetical protein
MADCDPHLADPFAFPRRPSNRAALHRFAYRIGDYATMREAMIRHVDGQVELAAWTHRGADDPAIALIEGAAILGDILSFYQERYGNEAFLRTAAWRDSVADLVRLTGYRLAPALGGKATLAVEVKPGREVKIPAGWPVKADLEERKEPGEFQTLEAFTAWPHLSRFRLYRQRHYYGSVPASRDTAELATVGGSDSEAAIAAVDLKAGDRLMLVPEPPVWEHAGTGFTAFQKEPQVLTVKAVRAVVGRTLVTFETPFDLTWSVPVRAYRLGRSFRHFGQASPTTYTRSIKDGSNEVTGTKEYNTDYDRHVHSGNTCSHTSSGRSIDNREVMLDQAVKDLAVGGELILSLKLKRNSTTRDLTVVRRITRLSTTTTRFGQQNGPTTIVRIDQPVVRHTGIWDAMADVRDYQVHELTSPEIGLRREAATYGGTIASGTEALWFYGTKTEVRALAGRRITLVHEEDGRVETLCNVNTPDDFTGADRAKMWALSFDAPPRLFTRSDFDEEKPTISVFGNLVEVNEGKAVPMTLLGNGDARAAFQTFKLPKPLTYHLSPGATPPEVPELEVYVANRLWKQVSSLFGQAPDAPVYIVREDVDGNSWVQFGDGLTGARLPSGVGNVAAAMRTGSGARGPLEAGADPAQSARIAEVKKLAIPAGIFGGADAEEGGKARIAAPGKVQGLDRLVSLADYESELLSIPGVERVRADWDIRDGVPGVALRVLLEAGREAELEAVRATIASYQKCRGPNRFALFVEQAVFAWVYCDLTYGLDPGYLATDVEAAIIAALAPDGAANADRDGLFSVAARRLGGPEYATRIEGLVNEVPGVTYAKATGLGRVTVAGDRLILPPAPRPLAALLSAAPTELLALKSEHLGLASAPPEAPGACA